MARITAVSSLAWANYTLYEALPRIAARGFKLVDIASFYNPDTFHFNFGSPVPSELRRMLDELGLTAICLNYHSGRIDSWDTAGVDKFVTNWARKLEHLPHVGIPMMTMTFGARNDRDDQDNQLENAVKGYDRVADIAKQHGVRMVIEVPHVYTIMYTPEKACWMFDHLTNDSIGAVVDSSHWGVIGYDLEEFLDHLGDRLAHVHLRDARGPDTGDFRQDLALTPGKGEVDFRRFAKALDNVGYTGDVTLELEYRDITFDAIEEEFDFGLRHLKDCGWEIPDDVENQLYPL